jgi:hypothetical protein
MAPRPTAKSFTPKQGQYLAFIYAYTRVVGRPPAEADMQRHFRVSPPSVHQMVLTLERAGLVSTTARSRSQHRSAVRPRVAPGLTLISSQRIKTAGAKAAESAEVVSRVLAKTDTFKRSKPIHLHRSKLDSASPVLYQRSSLRVDLPRKKEGVCWAPKPDYLLAAKRK